MQLKEILKFFNLDSKLTQKEFQSGAFPDTRKIEEKDTDIQFGEIVSAANPVNWVTKSQSAWRRFPIFNQDGSGSCVAQTMAKLFGILYWLKNRVYVHFSATHIYQRRVNKPAAGMGAVDVFNIAKQGVTLEELVPSQSMTDAQMDTEIIPQYKQEVGKIFKVGEPVYLPILDIDTVASVIQTTGKGVMIWFYFKYEEWTDVPVVLDPALTAISPGTIRHSVAAVDFTLYNGEKAIIIEDSWGPNYGKSGQRVITEKFFKQRNFFAGYPMDFVFESQTSDPNKPKYNFMKDLSFIPWDDKLNRPLDYAKHEAQKADVIALQNILKYEGFFPKNISSTGYYGALTKDSVYKYQTHHKVALQTELDSLMGRIVGPSTLAQLNKDYN